MGTKRVLNPVPQLAQNFVWNIIGILGAEIHAYTLRPDESNNLVDASQQREGSVTEQQMRLVENEDQPRKLPIACLGEMLKQLRQQPEKNAGIQPRPQYELVSREDAD